MIKPDSLAEFAKNTPNIEAAGRVLCALVGRPVPDLQPMEKAMVAVISYDCQKMETHLEERREKQREYTKKWRKNTQKDKVDGSVSICENHTPPITHSITPSITPSNTQSPEPNNARTREVAAAKPPFGSGEVSPKVKQRAEENVETLRETYVAQFVRTLRSAENCGNPDGPFYDGDVPLEYICCALAADNAVGTWRAYIHKLGADAVREECCTFYHECTAGEVPANRAAALNARLKALCDMENA